MKQNLVYVINGDLNSDYKPTGNITSSNRGGFWSNKNSSLVYRYKNPYQESETEWLSTNPGNNQTEITAYQRPVVQTDAALLDLYKVSKDGSNKLNGAVFEIYDDLSKDPLKEYTTSGSGDLAGHIEIGRVTNGKTYYIKEEIPPAGYLQDNVIFKIEFNGKDTKVTVLDGNGEPGDFNPDDYITEQVFYTSADGTRIPMFLTYRKDIIRDGSNPVYLYGYGGFNVSLPPSFSPNRLVWLENGGIYAQANLRGGAEYGEEWHQAGTKLNKQNVFNDFIAAAEFLITENWTTSDNLVIEGGSNGGLLVGAVTNMRPELFRVAIPRVGVMDMMRYHLFTIGWNWAPDYGTSADSPEMASYLLEYSPLHNIKNDGTPYPAILVTTADHDDRVVPAHSFKYAAALQAANTGDSPKLIRIDSKAGHGGGKPVSKVIDEYTDIYSFIFHNLGIEPASVDN